MAILNLDRVWVTNTASAESVNAQSSGMSESESVDGEVRHYASGRARAYTQVGTTREVSVMLRLVSHEDRDQLKTWKGQALLYRDSFGTKLYGVFFDLDITPIKGAPGYVDINVSVTEISYEEG